MKNKRNFFKQSIFWIWIMIWFLSLGICYFIISNYIHEKKSVPQICSWENCFTVELARTTDEHQLGLMNRTNMAEKAGMLFIFPKTDLYSFRMKNTLIPLDMLRIDDTLHVVKIMTAQPCISDPCTIYNPEIWATYVLEINAGITAKYGIVEWTKMKFINM